MVYELIGRRKIVQNVSISHSFPEVLQKRMRQTIYLSLFLRHIPYTHPQNIVNISCKQIQVFYSQMQLLKVEIERWQKGNYAVVLLAGDEERAKKLKRTLEDYEIDAIQIGKTMHYSMGNVKSFRRGSSQDLNCQCKSLPSLRKKSYLKND